MTVGIAALVVSGALSIVTAVSAAPKRSVDLEITLPNGATPRAIAREGEGAKVKLPTGEWFGFVPSIQGNDHATVVVGIWDLDSIPVRKVGVVEVEIGGAIVRSDTVPSFGLRVVRIITSK